MTEGIINLLGSTGSIGTQALDVARQSGLQIQTICAGRNGKLLEAQVREFKPAFCALADEKAARDLRIRLADTNVKVFSGEQGICRMIEESDADITLNAILGESGLAPTLAALHKGGRLALANKESLVVAGDLVMQTAKDTGTEIIPVDSEHCAIHQCLRAGSHEAVKKLIITASGGPFFGKKRQELTNVTAREALAHPTWSMGAKITVDSATLMNKGFELIEASHLFDIPMDRIEAVVHRESIIHSMVEYIDNGIIAQMSVPDMRFCIHYGICGGQRKKAVIPELDLTAIGNLSFFKPDPETFPLLKTAISCGRIGGGMPAVLNAANEVAVDAFLEGRVSFGGLEETVMKTVDALGSYSQAKTLAELLEADAAARKTAKSF